MIKIMELLPSFCVADNCHQPATFVISFPVRDPIEPISFQLCKTCARIMKNALIESGADIK